MALITCPECKNEISDQATSCPVCGYPLEKTMESQPTAPSNHVADVATVAPSKKSRNKLIPILAIAAIVIVGAICIAFFVNRANTRKEYIANLELVKNYMLEGGAEAENTCNLITSVWNNAIFKKEDPETDPYTKKSTAITSDKASLFYDDFNDALSNLFLSDEYQDSTQTIEASQSLVNEYMKKLQSPPDDLKNCYDTLNDMYDEFSGFTNLAIKPTGSLQSFTETFHQYDTNFMKYYEKLKIQIPEK